MSCATYFDPFDLGASSLETEIGWSTYCIPNYAKLVVFLVLFLTNFAVAVAACVMVLQRQLQLIKRVAISLVCIGCTANTGVYAMHLAGVQSPARYLLYPVFTIAMVAACCIMMVQWYETIAAIARPGREVVPRRKMVYVFIVVNSLGYLVLNPTLAMVYYDSPLILNWMYSFMIFYNGVTGVILGVAFIVLSYGLMKACKPADGMDFGDKKMSTVFKKLRQSVIMGMQSTIFSVALMCFPLWVYFTSNSEDPGLQGHFYFQYVFMATNHTACAAFGLWVLSKSPSAVGASGSSGAGSASYSSKITKSNSVNTGLNTKEFSSSYALDELTSTP